MARPSIDIRPAGAHDLRAIERIAAANGEPTVAPGWPGFLYLDVLRTSATLLVATRSGTVVGFAGASVIGGRRPAAHVTDLFVDPPAQGLGVGGRLLAALVAAVGAPDWTTSSSSDPRALTLYARAGMRPRWPILYLAAPIKAIGVVRRAGVSVRPTTIDEAAATDLAWSHRDFAPQYRHWARRPGATALLVEIRGRLAAVGIVRDGRIPGSRVVDHAAIAPGVEPSAAILALVGSDPALGGAWRPQADSADPPRAATEQQPTLKLAIAGMHPAVPTLLATGFEIRDHDTFCASSARIVDPLRVIPDPSFG